ncbi:hypothetical protein ACWF9B_04655 [Streptomyces sp. NPDC055089]
MHRAVDGEIDGHVQTGEPLHVDATCFLLSQGADPTRRSHGGTGVSAHHMAFVSRHWLADALFEAWLTRGDTRRCPWRIWPGCAFSGCPRTCRTPCSAAARPAPPRPDT